MPPLSSVMWHRTRDITVSAHRQKADGWQLDRRLSRFLHYCTLRTRHWRKPSPGCPGLFPGGGYRGSFSEGWFRKSKHTSADVSLLFSCPFKFDVSLPRPEFQNLLVFPHLPNDTLKLSNGFINHKGFLVNHTETLRKLMWNLEVYLCIHTYIIYI